MADEGRSRIQVKRGIPRLLLCRGPPRSDATVDLSFSPTSCYEVIGPSRVRRESRVVGLLEKVDTCFWWGLYDRQPLRSWTNRRLALLGDAAHAMLPHSDKAPIRRSKMAWRWRSSSKGKPQAKQSTPCGVTNLIIPAGAFGGYLRQAKIFDRGRTPVHGAGRGLPVTLA